MTVTLTWYWWFTPLLITFAAAIPGMLYRPRGDYDFGGAIMGLIWMVATAVAWIVAIILRLSI